MIIATAGHVDHGKTELVKALTGIDTDRLPEEKVRGLTIDLGFAYQALPGQAVLGFVDVPGHEKFIRNMLAGVGGIDLGLLVVAADDGVMPQTREHLAILDLLGIERLVVAISKIDRVDDVRVEAVRKDVDRLLELVGYATAASFAVCAPRNQGIDALSKALHEQARRTPARKADGYFRMAIDRAFHLKGVGLVATGLVADGSLRVDDKLVASSNGAPLRVRGIRAHNQECGQARAGERCAINIAGRGIDERSLRRGDWLLHPRLFAPTRRIDVELRVLDSEARALKHWTPTHLHLATERMPARVAVLGGGSIAAGEQGLAQLVLERDAFAVHGDRFVLRDQSAQRSIGGGRVLDPFAPKRGRARATRLAALQAMTQQDPGEVLAALAGSSPVGIAMAPFALAHNLPDDRLEAMISARGLRRLGQSPRAWVFDESRWQDLREGIVGAIRDFHQSSPDLPGAGPQNIQLALAPFFDLEIIDIALNTLVEQNRLGRSGSRIHLPSHQIHVSGPDRQLWSRVTPYLAPQSGSPMSLHQAAQALEVTPGTLEASLKRAVKAGEMAQLGKNRFAPNAYVAHLAQAAEALARQTPGGEFSVAEYCKQSQTGRNFAIALLEYFDRLGFTGRRGNTRRIRQPAATVFADSRGRGAHPGGAPGLQTR